MNNNSYLQQYKEISQYLLPQKINIVYVATFFSQRKRLHSVKKKKLLRLDLSPRLCKWAQARILSLFPPSHLFSYPVNMTVGRRRGASSNSHTCGPTHPRRGRRTWPWRRTSTTERPDRSCCCCCCCFLVWVKPWRQGARPQLRDRAVRT